MKKLATMATIGLLVCAGPALGGNSCPDGCLDLDGVDDHIDNCSEVPNPVQDDTDADDCGNLCDADYDNDGTVGFGDFGFFTSSFGTVPGPSGTTAGTIACP